MSDIANTGTQVKRLKRKLRVRAKIHGTKEQPRLRINVSNQHVSAQIINDDNQATLVSSTTVGKKSVKGSLTEKAEWVGKDIAKKAKAKKIKKVVFDRGYRLYHGRVKALADAARESGLEF